MTATRQCVAVAAAFLLVLAAAVAAGQAPNVLAHYAFEGTGERVPDRTGNGHDGFAPGCARVEGRIGQALRLDGDHGMTVEGTPDLKLRAGYSIEFWLWLDRVPVEQPLNLVSKDGEFLLRADRAGVGNTISFYVSTDGSYEPRVRGPVPAADRWHHVVASWDGKVARLFVDGIGYSGPRAGEISPGDAPIIVGGPCPLGAGVVGRIDELRIYSVAIGPQTALDHALAPEGAPGQPVTSHGFDFTRAEAAEVFLPLGATRLSAAGGGLQLGIAHPNDGMVCSRLEADLADRPVVECVMASDGGARGTLLFVTTAGAGQLPFAANADGQSHRYHVDAHACPAWQGKLRALGLRPSDVAPANVTVGSLRLLAAAECQPKLIASALRPGRGWLRPGESVEGTWLLRNEGPARETVTVEIAAGGGEAALLTPGAIALGPGEEHLARWSVTAAEAPTVNVTTLARARSAYQRRSFPLAVSPPAPPWSALQSVLTSGFPRAMDFRHLGPSSVPVHAHNQVLLVDLLGEKIAAARDFKQRFPQRVVLMQVNDEPNGMWGSWFTVPEGFARKEGLRFRPEVFPSPVFAGFWLLAPGGTLRSDLPADGAEATVTVGHPERFRVMRRGRAYLADVLIYARRNGDPDFTRADFATVTTINEGAGTITLARWPTPGDRAWHAFRASEATIAPSCGDIYGMRGKLLKTWLPNLTRFCPRDPMTGLNAAQWWAAHSARLYREHIAAGDGPVPDGFEFDWPPFWAHNLSADCNNDGEADGCEFAGVSYWALGMHDVFHHLRNGGPGFEGIGQEPLLLADSSGPDSQRSFDLLNGAENEEFPGGTDFRTLSPQLDLYLLWCRDAREPRLPYLQSRFPSELSTDDPCTGALDGKFHASSRLRLNAAAACMGLGVHTYRDNSKRDVGSILDGGSDVEYDLDEHHQGDDGTYGWLGLPVGEPQRVDSGGDPLLSGRLDEYELSGEGDEVAAAPLEEVRHTFQQDAGAAAAVKADVTSIRSATDAEGGLGGWPAVRLRRMWAARIVSPPIDRPVAAGKEVALTMWVDADPQYDDLEGLRYASLKREIGLRLEEGDRIGYAHSILVGPTPRRVELTLTSPSDGHQRLAVGIGAELGPVWLSDVTLRRGCAEVMARRFEHGVVLMNGSASTPWDFDLAELFPGLHLRRLRGTQCPQVNDSKPVGPTLRVAPLDGAFLQISED